eukprot:gene21352-28287_t
MISSQKRSRRRRTTFTLLLTGLSTLATSFCKASERNRSHETSSKSHAHDPAHSARAFALPATAARGICSRGIIDAGQALGPELDAEAIPPHEVKYPLLLPQHLSLPLVTSLKLALVSKND